jgi:nucleoside-diphosphate-sugar epimerase
MGVEGTLTAGAGGGWSAPAAGRRRVAVTGAAGFIGSAIAEALVARGDEVLALDLVEVDRPGVRSVVADVATDGPWVEALIGCDVVVHTAAIVAEAGDRARFEAVNVGATRRVCEAAADADVDRVIHLSSVVVYGDRFPRGSLRDEDDPTAPTGGPYTDTKIAAEHAALAAASERRLDLTIVRPGDVYGAGSIPWVLRPLDLLRKGMFTLVDGGVWPLSPVYIDDLVAGILATLDQDRSRGRIYNLAGPPVRVATSSPTTLRTSGARWSRCPVRPPGSRCWPSPGLRRSPGRHRRSPRKRSSTSPTPAATRPTVLVASSGGRRGCRSPRASRRASPPSTLLNRRGPLDLGPCRSSRRAAGVVHRSCGRCGPNVRTTSTDVSTPVEVHGCRSPHAHRFVHRLKVS